MTHRGPFQPLPFCDSVILNYFSKIVGSVFAITLASSIRKTSSNFMMEREKKKQQEQVLCSCK